jgi:hypothetical protein
MPFASGLPLTDRERRPKRRPADALRDLREAQLRRRYGKKPSKESKAKDASIMGEREDDE